MTTPIVGWRCCDKYSEPLLMARRSSTRHFMVLHWNVVRSSGMESRMPVTSARHAETGSAWLTQASHHLICGSPSCINCLSSYSWLESWVPFWHSLSDLPGFFEKNLLLLLELKTSEMHGCSSALRTEPLITCASSNTPMACRVVQPPRSWHVGCNRYHTIHTFSISRCMD
mgnify:CR=1 FL=1